MGQLNLFCDTKDFHAIRAKLKSVIGELDSDDRLQILRDLVIDEIGALIKKFPSHTQMEIVAILADNFLYE